MVTETLSEAPGATILKPSLGARDTFSAPQRKPDEWMYLSLIYTRVHGEWLRYAKTTSQYSLPFSLKSEMIGAPK